MSKGNDSIWMLPTLHQSIRAYMPWLRTMPMKGRIAYVIDGGCNRPWANPRKWAVGGADPLPTSYSNFVLGLNLWG